MRIGEKRLSADHNLQDLRMVRIAPDHADWVVRWRMQPENRARFLSDVEITREMQLAWTERSRNDPTDLTLVALRAGAPVGMVALYDIADGHAEYGRILVDDACRRRRVGLAISGCIVAFGFAALKVESIHANCQALNTAILGLLDQLGFVRIDTWRHAPSGQDVVKLEIVRAAWSESAACGFFDRLIPVVVHPECAAGIKGGTASSA